MEKLNQVTHQIEGLLLMHQVKNINKLWDFIVESKNKSGHKKFDDIIKHLENTAINTLVQTQKIQNVHIESNENDISKELKQNLSKEDICVKGWINAFLPKKVCKFSTINLLKRILDLKRIKRARKHKLMLKL